MTDEEIAEFNALIAEADKLAPKPTWRAPESEPTQRPGGSLTKVELKRLANFIRCEIAREVERRIAREVETAVGHALKQREAEVLKLIGDKIVEIGDKLFARIVAVEQRTKGIEQRAASDNNSVVHLNDLRDERRRA